MGEQAQFIAALKNEGDQMTGLTTTIGAQSVAKIIKTFEGNPKEFKDWIKGIEKYGILTNLDVAQYKLVAYQASKGPLSDFLKRHLGANRTQGWADIKKELTSRFAEVTDHQYALSLLRKVRQKEGESIRCMQSASWHWLKMPLSFIHKILIFYLLNPNHHLGI